MIERRHSFTKEHFVASIDNFLNFREYRMLEGKGSISMKFAKEKASREYVDLISYKKLSLIRYTKNLSKLMRSYKALYSNS
nr:RhuM [Streptococcus pyogenes]